MKRKQKGGLLVATLLAGTTLASPALAQVIDFESETSGSKPNGYVTDDSPYATFTDTSGADLNLGNYGSQGSGELSLAVGNDDASGLQVDFAGIASNVSYSPTLGQFSG